MSAAGFDRAQSDYDAQVPTYLEDEVEEQADDWCELCGDQAVCPECVGA